jgi:vacuolar-type H+-ATPase subunit E/Vma4
VQELIDWLVSSDLQRWTEIRDRLSLRRGEAAERIAGRLAGGFEYDRARLLDTVGKAAQEALDRHDHPSEAARMANSVQAAVTNAALIEAGAVGLGTAVSLLATSTAADVTGLVAAGVLASVGFFVIPHRRRAAKRELRTRIATLRRQLMEALGAQFHKEVERSVRRIEEALAPYVQFVEGERQTLTERRQGLADLQARLTALRSEVDAGPVRPPLLPPP